MSFLWIATQVFRLARNDEVVFGLLKKLQLRLVLLKKLCYACFTKETSLRLFCVANSWQSIKIKEKKTLTQKKAITLDRLPRSLRSLAMTMSGDCFVVASLLPRNDDTSGICVFVWITKETLLRSFSKETALRLFCYDCTLSRGILQ